MNKKQLILGLLLVAVLAGGVKLYQIIQHARLDLVTLNVTSAPLAEVLQRIASQTGEQVVADQALTGGVTLNVRNAPLRQVLDQIAGQVDAYARLDFAVGESDASLRGFEHVIQHGQDPATEGWSNFLSAPANELEPPDNRSSSRSDDVGNRAQQRIVIRADGGDGQAKQRATLTTVGSDGARRTIDLSTERLFVDSGVAARLSTQSPVDASAETAAELARQAAGTWSAFYTIEALPVPAGELPPELRQLSWQSADEKPDAVGHPQRSMEDMVRRHRFDQLTHRTPEQRARAAASSSGAGVSFDIDIEEN